MNRTIRGGARTASAGGPERRPRSPRNVTPTSCACSMNAAASATPSSPGCSASTEPDHPQGRRRSRPAATAAPHPRWRDRDASRDRARPSRADRPRYRREGRIARACLDLIDTGDAVFLDSGSTVLAIAEQLTVTASAGEPRNVNVLTNALAVAQTLADRAGIRHTVLGGYYRPTGGCSVGPLTEEDLTRFTVNLAFLGVTGVTEQGFTVADLSEAQVKRAVIDRARRVVITMRPPRSGRRTSPRSATSTRWRPSSPTSRTSTWRTSAPAPESNSSWRRPHLATERLRREPLRHQPRRAGRGPRRTRPRRDRVATRARRNQRQAGRPGRVAEKCGFVLLGQQGGSTSSGGTCSRGGRSTISLREEAAKSLRPSGTRTSLIFGCSTCPSSLPGRSRRTDRPGDYFLQCLPPPL